jgi:hypothetical protein
MAMLSASQIAIFALLFNLGIGPGKLMVMPIAAGVFFLATGTPMRVKERSIAVPPPVIQRKLGKTNKRKPKHTSA